MDLRPQDRVMAVLPFSYCYGISLLHTHLAAGGSRGAEQPLHVPRKGARRSGSEAMHRPGRRPRDLPDPAPQDALRGSGSFPRCAGCNKRAGSCPTRFLREFRQALPQVKLYVMYGQTEATARLSYLPARAARRQVGLDRPRPAAHAAGSASAPTARRSGRAPARWARSSPPARTSRRAIGTTRRKPPASSATASSIPATWPGWMRDGFLFLVERRRDFIKAMGNRVSPKEVEEVLAELPQVVEAAVIGVADELWGEAVKAFLVTTTPGCLDRRPGAAPLFAASAELQDSPVRGVPFPACPRPVTAKWTSSGWRRAPVEPTGAVDYIETISCQEALPWRKSWH